MYFEPVIKVHSLILEQIKNGSDRRDFIIEEQPTLEESHYWLKLITPIMIVLHNQI